MALTQEAQEALSRAQRFRHEARDFHDDFVQKVEHRYKVWRGVLDAQDDAAQWTTKSHPPFIMHIVETALASLIDDRLKYRISPAPNLESMMDPGAAERSRMGARAHQILFDYQVKADRFTGLQRAFVHQNSIAGLTVAKTLWSRRQERRRRLEPVQVPLEGDFGPILDPMTGQPMMQTTLEEKTGLVTVYDGPTTEVRDVRDFMWTPNAVSLDKSPWVIDRVWKHPEEVKRGFKSGFYGPDRGGISLEEYERVFADSMKDDTSADERVSREQVLWNVDRTKGLVEIWEVWDKINGCVITVANKSILLSYRKGFPFFHEDYPFVVCSTQPDLFRINGVSQVEKIAHLQTLLWDISNQSVDNLRLINNAIAMFRPDVEDIDAYEFYPGARWLVEDPKQVEMWTPNPIPAEISLGREALIKGDMQNLAGGFPFSSGTDSQFVDQKTATGASLVSSIAQRGLDLIKQQIYQAWERIGQQRMILNQQFIRTPTVAPVLGLDSEEQIEVIMPELLQGDFQFNLEPMPSAMMQQEEQAAAQALLQMALAAFPVAAVAGKPLNLDAFVEDLLRAHGKEDFARYFSASAPAALPAGGGGGAGAVPPGAPSQPSMGVTGQNSINPAVSPSSGVSLSPVTALQRAQAQSR